SFETATEAVSNMGVGWNLGNTLDAHNGSRMPNIVQSETYWGQPITKPELMPMMKNAGFGAIRVPVTWFPHMDTAGNVDAEWMKRVHEIVDYVLDAGLYCILNVHHDTGADENNHKSWLKADESVYNNVRERYEKLWQQIATEFKDYGEKLLFESYNEMLDTYNSWCFASFASPSKYDANSSRSSYNAINSYAQSFVDVVRATGGNNAKRNLVVNTYGACSGGGTWNNHLKDPLKEMKLPTDAAGAGHIIFQVHSYPTISPLSSVKNEVNDMISSLKTHLVAKGAPVIIGEWGTSDTGADYQSNRSTLFQFVDYFVQTAKENGIVTFFWMGLSDGSIRSLPAFSQADLAERIVKAYHGSSFKGEFPTIDDFDVTYHITYTGDWQELNLCTSTISLSDYKGIRVEMAQLPAANSLQVKSYGEGSKEQYDMLGASTLNSTITFRSSSLGSKIQRITLQTMKGAQEIRLKRAFLIRKDNTEEELKSFSPYWGCSVEMEAQSLDIPTIPLTPSDSPIYNLQGQRIHHISHPGIYIK
ncbi:MAG: glycoside hydrolase family 5 protein, partial [Bacteroidaceae bacterium]|nr:glycoside hydrolase family 5 protein [Bacteroidaceae bacterium]